LLKFTHIFEATFTTLHTIAIFAPPPINSQSSCKNYTPSSITNNQWLITYHDEASYKNEAFKSVYSVYLLILLVFGHVDHDAK